MKRRSNSVNAKHNSRYAKFDSREIKNYFEIIQYKINANANASHVASQAAFAALKAYNKAYENINAIFIANIAIKEANLVTKEAIYSAKFAAIDAEQSYTSAAISLYKKQINDLYYIIDKPNTPESILSDDTHVTNRSNEFKSNKGNIVYILSKCFKKKSAQIYDVSHQKKRKSHQKKRKSNILMKLVKYFYNDGDSEEEEEEESDNEPG